MTVAEFLTWDDGTDTRYELIDGRPVAMAPVAPSHSIIVVNLSHELKARLKAPCYAGSEAGVEHPDRNDTFYEADIVVSCTPVAPGHGGDSQSCRGDRGAFAVNARARSRPQGLRLPSHPIGSGDRARGQRAAPHRDLAPPRRQVGSRGSDRRRGARAGDALASRCRSPRSTPTAASDPALPMVEVRPGSWRSTPT